MGSYRPAPQWSMASPLPGPRGPRALQTFDRKGDAERFLQRNGADLQRGEWIDPALRRVLFAEWADQWWQTTARLRPVDTPGLLADPPESRPPRVRDRTLASLDFMDVERFVATKLAEGVLGPKKSVTVSQ